MTQKNPFLYTTALIRYALAGDVKYFNHERQLISRQNYKEHRRQSFTEWREFLAA